MAGITAFLSTAFRSDGALANGSITTDALSSELQLGLAPPTVWTPGNTYNPGDAVTYGLGLYACQAENVASSSFPLDLGAGLWAQVANFATMGLLAAGSVGASQIAPLAVTAGALAPGSVDQTALQPGAVDRANLAADVGQIPVGAELAWPGIRPPAGWLFEFGQAVSRTTYAALLAVLSEATTCSPTQGSTSLPVAEDLTAFDLAGAALEGPGIPFGALIGGVTPTTITMTTVAGNPATATATSAGTALTIFPHGNGDGATTFNLPDWRGRTGVGRDTMGGAASGRLGGVLPTSLAAAGGAANVTLGINQVPAHQHGIGDPGHSHGVSDPGHTHDSGVPTSGSPVSAPGSGGVAALAYAQGSDATTKSATTALTVNSGKTGITITNYANGNADGSTAAHSNMQPSIVRNVIIFAGVSS